ncbi:uncharacterized protein LOC129409404 [Boleophthalmus pectinirostris]|uniref:uncharacterized protein LOC129409404 n=1 Tax=Boleophthalmus pectinirostris TaxID=150288 RepID=UPI0024301F7D|nr:uncharacterized protein LOC129409404 [Boleophthalmus pectinirostris]
MHWWTDWRLLGCSRWCLLEANMSLFRDCLERKPIIPVLLEPEVCVPLHLCHLTYLEADHPDFINKLLHVLCTPNRELRGASVVPYQPPSVYNGKALQSLTAANEESLRSWDAGVFSDMDIPDQLRLIVHNEDTYRQAIAIINKVSQTKLCLWRRDDDRNIVREMQKAVGQANVLMSKEKVLMGCRSNSKIYLVYVSLDGCRQVFEETFSERACSEDMFNRALLFFSSGYTCCLAKKHFPFDTPVSSGHLPRTVCFCQYVRHQLDKGQWLDQ